MQKIATVLAAVILFAFAAGVHAQTTECEGEHLYRVVLDPTGTETVEFNCKNGSWQVAEGTKTCCGFPLKLKVGGMESGIGADQGSQCRYNDDQLIEVTVKGTAWGPTGIERCFDR